MSNKIVDKSDAELMTSLGRIMDEFKLGDLTSSSPQNPSSGYGGEVEEEDNGKKNKKLMQ